MKNSSNVTYIHYGASEFIPEKCGITRNNMPPTTKPIGGLWASRTSASCGWEWLNSTEHIRPECKKENSFEFTLAHDANVIRVSNAFDAQKLPRRQDDPFPGYSKYIDFEACMRMGVDAIELCFYGREFEEDSILEDFADDDDATCPKINNLFWGWDCDSIVILNPDVVVPV